MGRNIVASSLVVALLTSATTPVWAAELAQRRDISPTDRAKVLSVQSKRWLGFGTTGQTTDNTIVPSTVGARVCTTNVGIPQNNGSNAGNTGFGPQNRFGPQAQKDNIVVVSGDIINLCK